MSKTQKHFTSDGKPYKGDTHKTGRQGVASRVRKSIPLPPRPFVLRVGVTPKFSPLFQRQ